MVGDILQPTHLLFILVVALLVLGPKRLPEVGRQLGSGLRDFRAALSGERPDHDERPPAQSYAPSPPAFAESHLQPAGQEEAVAQEEPTAHIEPDYATDPILPDDPQTLGPERFESPVPEHEHDQLEEPAEAPPLEFDPPLGSAEAAPTEPAPPLGSPEPAPTESDPSLGSPEPAPAESDPSLGSPEPAPTEPVRSAGGHELSLDPSQPPDPDA